MSSRRSSAPTPATSPTLALGETPFANVPALRSDAAEYGPERSVNAARRRLADIVKAGRLRGFRNQVGLEEGLARRVSWWQDNKLTMASA